MFFDILEVTLFYTVYKITNKINNKIYIGCHITTNPNDDYIGSGKHLLRAVRKYGGENFAKEILHVFDTADEMFAKESELVNEEFVARKDTYNIKLGGSGGWDYINANPKIKNKAILTRSLSLKNNQKCILNGRHWGETVVKHKLGIHNPIYNELRQIWCKKAFKDKHHTEETKRKIGEKNSKHQSGKNNSQYGTIWITNGTENKKIQKEELDKWVSLGYHKGRVI